MAYALEIQDIHKVFNRGTINEKVALNGVNLNLNPGDFVTIIGAVSYTHLTLPTIA